MNENFLQIISATPAERRDLFLTTATRLGTTEQNIEKDFWVCWVLDALFNGLPPGGPRLLFKGGTSLSKAFALISRFSEDIDHGFSGRPSAGGDRGAVGGAEPQKAKRQAR